MNLTKLKTFAPAARSAFIAAVTRRAGILGILPDRAESVTESGDVALIGGQPFPRSIVPLRKKLLELIQHDGFDQTMEAMAYTWFNRLVALRFMELHDGWLDHGYRVLSHPEGGPLPEILQHAEHVTLSGLDREDVIRLKLDGNRDEDLYRLLLLAQCAELNHILPDVFSRLDDATILLLPDNLLHSDSVIRQLVAGSDADDWQQVEVLGWLYQFYISEKKDAVMARKSAVPTEDIPAVTQLFTPHWIVRYLVENSLGRLWLLNRPGSRLREHMPYYIEGEAETNFLKITKPEEIRLVDPAVGSGHMLTYAFDLLVHIYEEEGYAANDIPGLILKHNLHGTEICPRAAQLAELALVFKAREKSRRFFSPGNLVRPNIIELQNVRFEENELREYFQALGVQPSTFSPDLVKLLHQFEEAKNFGSLIQPCLNEAEVQNVRLKIQNLESNIQNSSGQLFLRETHLKVLCVLEQAEALTQRYHVVVANPPYLGGKGLNNSLRTFAQSNYVDSKSDLFAMFMERGLSLIFKDGLMGMINLPSWLFLSSFEAVRRKIISECTIESMLHMGRGIFGIDWGSVAFIIKKSHQSCKEGRFFKLHKSNFQHIHYDDISRIFLNTNADKFYKYNFDEYRSEEGINEIPTQSNPDGSQIYYSCHPTEFKKFPGIPIAYLATKAESDIFSRCSKVDDSFDPRQGMATGDNATFVRDWFEVSQNRSFYSCSSKLEAFTSGRRWFPYNKGGSFMRWYGNHEDLVAFDEPSYNLLKNQGNHCPSEQRYFAPSVGWSKISSGSAAFRLYPKGFIFDVAGCSIFQRTPDETLHSVAGFLNSVVAKRLLSYLSPTLNFEVGTIKNLPLMKLTDSDSEAVKNSVEGAVSLARADWDNFETSWDFRNQPLLRPGLKGATLEASWRNWEAQSTSAICRMQELETENNRLFIAAYGLEGELQPEVPEEQITLARAEVRRDMAAFLSYAVGCMMGRYSLDAEGLILANAGDTLEDYVRIVAEKTVASDQSSVISEKALSFAADADGIIPILDGEWFEDDAVPLTKEFLRVTFGEVNLQENLRFIEDSLGKDLRTYFQNDFYKDHLQTYKNRPIYWLFSSGKHKAFQCLVYLHRYTPATLARIRTEYAIPLQGKLSARITRLEEEVTQTSSSVARKKLQTDLDKCKKQIVELLAFDEQLRSYADQAIPLDLDDGVKVNYAKFGTLLAESKKICGTKDD